MDERIIYKTDEGRVAVIIPAPGCGLTAMQIALKDVPTGKPFKIVDATEIPSDRSQRALWMVDTKDLTDGVGADYGAGSPNVFIPPEVTP